MSVNSGKYSDPKSRKFKLKLDEVSKDEETV